MSSTPEIQASGKKAGSSAGKGRKRIRVVNSDSEMEISDHAHRGKRWSEADSIKLIEAAQYVKSRSQSMFGVFSQDG